VIPLHPVQFTKLVLGVLLAGFGAILLAGHLGFLPAGVGGWILHYWPILLIAVGLALLANAVNNGLLGWISAILVLGLLGYAAWWAYHHGASAQPYVATKLDLSRPPAEALTLRARVMGGSLVVNSKRAAHSPRSVDLIVSGVAVAKDAEPRFVSSGGAAILDWPAAGSHVYQAPLGGELRATLPDGFRIRLEAKSLFSEVRADFSRLRPERCDIEAICSGVRVIATGSAHPSLIRVHGALASVDLRIPPSGPVRIEFLSPLSFRSLPEDFAEQVAGRSKVKVWTSEGSGPPLRIRVESPFIHLRVRREAVRAL